jgi:hypothetical protein
MFVAKQSTYDPFFHPSCPANRQEISSLEYGIIKQGWGRICCLQMGYYKHKELKNSPSITGQVDNVLYQVTVYRKVKKGADQANYKYHRLMGCCFKNQFA